MLYLLVYLTFIHRECQLLQSLAIQGTLIEMDMLVCNQGNRRPLINSLNHHLPIMEAAAAAAAEETFSSDRVSFNGQIVT